MRILSSPLFEFFLIAKLYLVTTWRRAKPIFVFDAPTELKFFQAADLWAFAIHFILAKTGLRPGELTHTLIEDLDLDVGWLRVRAKPELGWNVKTGTD